MRTKKKREGRMFQFPPPENLNSTTIIQALHRVEINGATQAKITLTEKMRV
jgi:hypothetical protein